MAFNPNLLSAVRVVETRREDGSLNVEHMFDFPSMTDQSFKNDCDLNVIVKRFMKLNKMNNVHFNNYMNNITPKFSQDAVVEGSAPDYQDALQAQFEADEMFMSLPPEVRTRFNNSPHHFLEFVFKPENRGELAKMGLLTPEATARILAEANAGANPSKGDTSVSPAVE